MTARELFERLEKMGFADDQLFILEEITEDYITQWDTHKITDIFTADGKLYLDHEFYKY